MARTQYVAAVSNADIDALRTAMAAVSGNWAAYLFRDAVIRDDDPDDLDPPRGWATETPRDWDDRELDLLKETIAAAPPPSLVYQQVPAKLFEEDLDEDQTLDMWFATNNYRRRGVMMPAMVRASADGTADAQPTTTAYSVVSQWTTIDRLVRMTKKNASLVNVELSGSYSFGVRIEYEVVPGVTFGFRALKNTTPVGQELQTSDGDGQGIIEGPLDAGDFVGLVVRSSESATLKVLTGSVVRIKRESTA